MKCLACKYLKKGIDCSGKWEERTAYVVNSALRKKFSAVREGGWRIISGLGSEKPGRKSGFLSMGSGPRMPS